MVRLCFYAWRQDCNVVGGGYSRSMDTHPSYVRSNSFLLAGELRYREGIFWDWAPRANGDDT